MLRTTSHASREPVNTLVFLLNELFNFKSLKLKCFSFLSHILRYLNCHASVGITSLSDSAFHPPPHPDRIVVRHTHSPCHVASLWCRHHQCHCSLYYVMFPGCSLSPHPWLNHPNLWSHARHPFSPLPSCTSECQ